MSVNYRNIALKILRIFNEARARGPRSYGASTSMNDRSGFVNPNNSLASPQGHDPGYGRSKIKPRKPRKSIV